MFRKILLCALVIAFFMVSCKEKKQIATNTLKTDSTDNQNFFPVTKFILGELVQADSAPVTSLKIISFNGKDDSTWVTKRDVRAFAQPFLNPVIDTTNLKNLFEQKSFLDQTINSFTFSFDPIAKLPDTFHLKRWDVYIDPQKNKVSRIYLVKEIHIINSSKQTMQLTWLAGRWCKITSITEKENEAPLIKEEKMIWNFDEH